MLRSGVVAAYYFVMGDRHAATSVAAMVAELFARRNNSKNTEFVRGLLSSLPLTIYSNF
jgi:hypothetical protein